MKELIEKRKRLEAKSGILSAVFKQAGEEMDLSKVKKIGDQDVKSYTTVQISEEISKLNDELTDLGKEVNTLELVEKASQDVKALQERIKTPVSPITQPTPDAPSSDQKIGFKGLGDAIVVSDLFKNHQSGTPEGGIVQGFGLKELKTLFQTSAGWEPESTRIGRLVDAVTRPIQVIDIIPSGQTGQASIVYMEETTRTHSAAERAEAGAYAESTFVLEEKTSTVRSIGDSIPVTDEQLADVPQVQSYLNQRLAFGVASTPGRAGPQRERDGSQSEGHYQHHRHSDGGQGIGFRTRCHLQGHDQDSGHGTGHALSCALSPHGLAGHPHVGVR